MHVTGNTVVDELMLQRPRAERPELFARFGVERGKFALATVHRAENVDVDVRLPLHYMINKLLILLYNNR